MIYIGTFDDINGIEYTVKIQTEFGTTTKQITLGGSPFTTKMKGDDDTIYCPIKTQGAKVEVLTDYYLPDIYSSKAQGTKVTLLKGDEVIWIGYATPNLYTQDWDDVEEVLEIECIEGISTLKYIPYRQQNKGIKTIQNVIDKLLSECNCYTDYYVTTNIQLSMLEDKSIFEELKISENNFYKKDKKPNETEDDVAWKGDDVLEAICLFLGITCVTDGTSVYFLDYDAIKNGINTYWKYSIGSTAKTKVTLTKSYSIDVTSFSSNGSTLSLDNVYNKITVKTKVNDSEDSIADPTDNLIPYSNKTEENIITGDPTTQYGIYNGVYFLTDSKYKQYIFVKYYKNPSIECYMYNGVNDTTPLPSFSDITYNDTKNYYGSVYIKHYNTDYADGSDLIPIRSVSMDDYVLCMVHREGHTPNVATTLPSTTQIDGWSSGGANAAWVTQNALYPTQIAWSYKDTYKYPNTDNMYLTINFKSTYMDRRGCMYIVDEAKNDKTSSVSNFVWMKIRIGEWYLGGYYLGRNDVKYGAFGYNGEKVTDGLGNFDYKWTKNPKSMVRVYYEKDKSYNSQKLNILSNILWTDGIKTKEGICIALDGYAPEEFSNRPSIKQGDEIEVSMFQPHSMNKDYRCDAVFISDIKIGIEKSDLSNVAKDQDDSETEYTLQINDDYVNDFDNIEMKIHTYDGKKVNFSSVYKYDNSYLDTLSNIVLGNDAQLQNIFIESQSKFSSDKKLRSEYWLCYRMYKQYSTPSIILEMNFDNNHKVYETLTSSIDRNKTFIIDTIEKDYRLNSSEIRLVEKK